MIKGGPPFLAAEKIPEHSARDLIRNTLILMLRPCIERADRSRTIPGPRPAASAELAVPPHHRRPHGRCTAESPVRRQSRCGTYPQITGSPPFARSANRDLVPAGRLQRPEDRPRGAWSCRHRSARPDQKHSPDCNGEAQHPAPDHLSGRSRV
ncbi:MAG: hypothetical protein MZU97_07105 [Bacillus subtilis]|nr:hypothetical protein [Bacillus subtilis]